MKRKIMADIVGTENKAGQVLFFAMGCMACFVLLGALILAPELLDNVSHAISSPYWLLAPILPLIFIAVAGIL